MLNKYIIEPVSDFLSKIIIQKIRKTFNREPQKVVEITENELWLLLKKYQLDGKIDAEEFIKLGAFMRYILIKLNLRK